MLLSAEVREHNDLGKEATEVEIYLDQEGLRLLIDRLSFLKKHGDHLHFFSPQWGGDELTGQAVQEGNVASHHLRITLIEERDMENKDQL